MKEIMFLCVRYHEMYMMERAVKNCEDSNNYETLVKAYQTDKETFDEQYKKVENLINSKQK
jgi:hypothetical protein